MAGDLIRFVDAISATPNVRLDLNDEAAWAVTNFDAPPPRLRRAVSQNAMRNGGYVSSSQHEMRVLTISLELITADQDTNATQIQNLARELDRESNLLMYQPTGATKPVFFRTFRSDIAQLADVIAQKAMREVTVELLAEPYALGLRVDAVSSASVSEDPAATSNGMFLDVPSVQGDVKTPAFMWADAGNLSSNAPVLLCAEPSPLSATSFVQAESGTMGTDATVPTAVVDTNMSGPGNAGLTNYARISFATNAAMADRVTSLTTFAAMPRAGLYHIYARVRRSDTTSVFTFRAGVQDNTLGTPVAYFASVTPPAAAGANQIDLIDLGILEHPYGAGISSLGAQDSWTPSAPSLTFAAQRVSGTGTVDLDFMILIPARQTGLVTIPQGVPFVVIDGMSDAVYGASKQPFDPTALVRPTLSSTNRTGTLPSLAPGVTNRIYVTNLRRVGPPPAIWNLSYWPRYLYVRPASS